MSPVSHYTIYEVWCDNFGCDWNGPDDDVSAYTVRKDAVRDMRKHARECSIQRYLTMSSQTCTLDV